MFPERSEETCLPAGVDNRSSTIAEASAATTATVELFELIVTFLAS